MPLRFFFNLPTSFNHLTVTDSSKISHFCFKLRGRFFPQHNSHAKDVSTVLKMHSQLQYIVNSCLFTASWHQNCHVFSYNIAAALSTNKKSSLKIFIICRLHVQYIQTHSSFDYYNSWHYLHSPIQITYLRTVLIPIYFSSYKAKLSSNKLKTI